MKANKFYFNDLKTIIVNNYEEKIHTHAQTWKYVGTTGDHPHNSACAGAHEVSVMFPVVQQSSLTSSWKLIACQGRLAFAPL